MRSKIRDHRRKMKSKLPVNISGDLKGKKEGKIRE